MVRFRLILFLLCTLNQVECSAVQATSETPLPTGIVTTKEAKETTPAIAAADVAAAPEPVYLPHIANQKPLLYWGAYVRNAPWNMTDLDIFESIVGKPLAILHFGYPWKQDGALKPFPTPQMEAIRERGSIPLLGWGSWHLGLGHEQPDFRLNLIAQGSYDAFITEWAQDAAAWGQPFFLKFNWEMDGNWQFPWSVQLNGNTSADYVAAWRRVHDIFTAAGATNATWVWCPTTVSRNSVPLAPLYPGDEYVDWTCLHGYNFNDRRWLSFSQVFSGYPQNPFNSYQQILDIAPSKPMMLGEWASAEAGDGGAQKAAWIRDALEVQIPRNYPQVRAIVWFNWNSEEGRTWNIDSSDASAAAFASAIASQIYAANDFAKLSTSPISPLGE